LNNNYNSDLFFSRLKLCLVLQEKYKEMFYNLRDGLGGNQSLSHFPSISTNHNEIDATPLANHNHPLNRKTSITTTVNNHKSQLQSNGILMSNETTIFNHIDTFCNRIRCIIDQIVSMAQIKCLKDHSKELSRPKKEDFILNEENDDENENKIELDLNQNEIQEQTHKKIEEIFTETVAATNKDETKEQPVKRPSVRPSRNNFQKTISKIEEATNDDDEDEDFYSDESDESVNKYSLYNNNNNDLVKQAGKLFSTEQTIEKDHKEILKKMHVLSQSDIKMIRKFFKKDGRGPRIVFIFDSFMEQLKLKVKTIKSTDVLDVETKNSIM
jgi:hypothetical protein